MQITFSTHQNLPIATLVGALNAVHVEEARIKLHHWLDENPTAPNILLDFHGVEIMDSAGLGLLIGLLKTLKNREGDMHICWANQKVKMVFMVTRTESFFTFHPSLIAACTSISGA